MRTNKFNTNKVTHSEQMFDGTTNLIGGNGTVWSSTNPDDQTYARIDTPGTPGYFTQGS